MARWVKISTIGAASPLRPDASTPQLVELMREFWRAKIDQVLPDRPDLIVLPEYCDLYADHSPAQQKEYARQAGDTMLGFLREVAHESACYIAYPTLIDVGDDTYRNCTQILDRAGQVIGSYNKNHAAIGEMDHLNVVCGAEAPIIECDFGRLACVTCFDLNFDELRLKYVSARPDFILFSSLYHGGLLQAYWAYSCRAHFVSAIGITGLRSSILSPLGVTLATTTFYHDFVTAEINLDCCLAHLDFNQEKLQRLKAAHGTRVTLTDSDLLGVICIASEIENWSACDMAREFGIELLDEYLERSQARRNSK